MTVVEPSSDGTQLTQLRACMTLSKQHLCAQKHPRSMKYVLVRRAYDMPYIDAAPRVRV